MLSDEFHVKIDKFIKYEFSKQLEWGREETIIIIFMNLKKRKTISSKVF